MAWAFLLGHRLVVDVLAEEATSGGVPRAQGTCVIGDEGPINLWDLHRDGVSAVSGRGPVDDAPEEREYFLRRVARAAVGRLVDDVGKASVRPVLLSCVRSPIGICRVTSSSLLAPVLTAAVATPRWRARTKGGHPRSR